MRKTGLKLKQQNEGECEEKRRRRKLKNMKRDHWIGNGRKRGGMKSSNKRKG